MLVVNVNPYETSFDENKEVMKFAAVANGVRTTKEVRPAPTPAKEPRVVRLSMVDGGDEEDVIYEGKSTFWMAVELIRKLIRTAGCRGGR